MILAIVLIAGFLVLAAAVAVTLVALSHRWCREGDEEAEADREAAGFAAHLKAGTGRERSTS